MSSVQNKQQKQRHQNGKLDYKLLKGKDQFVFVVEFVDRFSLKYLEILDADNLLNKNLSPNYIIQRQKNTLKVQSVNQENQNHTELVNHLKKQFDVQYYYFKAQQNKAHIYRNEKFREAFSKPVFKKIFPYIRGFVHFSSNEQRSNKIGDSSTEKYQKLFEEGQILIYIQRQLRLKVKRIVKYLQSYTNQKVIYGLTDYFGQKMIKKGQFSIFQLERIIKKLIKYLQKDLKSKAIEAQLNIINITAYAPQNVRQKYKQCQQKFGILFEVQGMFQSLPQFYFNVSKIFNENPIVIGQVNNIYLPVPSNRISEDRQLQEAENRYKSEQNLVLFFGSIKAVAVLKFYDSFRDWFKFKELLRKGLFIISQNKGFTQEQITILIKEHRQVQQFMDSQQFTYKDSVDYDYKPIDQRSFGIRCEENSVPKFVKRAFDYLKRNTKIQTLRKQFCSELQIYLFMKLIKSAIQAKYVSVSFIVKNGDLYSLSKQSDLKDLNVQMQNQKRKIIKKLIKIPTVRRIQRGQKYQIYDTQFQNEIFCKQTCLQTTHYLFQDKIKIFVKSIHSIRSSRPFIISIIDRNYKECDYFMSSFKENSLISERYSKYGSLDRRLDRLINYSMSKSKYVSQMLVWYIQMEKNNLIDMKQLRRDIQQFVQKFKTEKKLQFVIPKHMNEPYFENFFIQLFKQFYQTQDYHTKQVTIFYDTDNSKQINQDIYKSLVKKHKDYFTLQAKLYLSQEQIQKIVLIEHYSVNFYSVSDKENKCLSPLNSFIFNYQTTKKCQDTFKVPLFMRKIQSVQTQFLLCLKQNYYYRIDNICRIQKIQINKNKALQAFSNVLKHYFIYSEYMVVYMNKEQSQVDNESLYYLIKEKEKVQSQTLKIKKVSINQQQKLIPKKDIQIEIFVKKRDILPKYVIQTHQDFIDQVKKKIFLDD